MTNCKDCQCGFSMRESGIRSSRATYQFRHARPIGGLVVVWFIASAPNFEIFTNFNAALLTSSALASLIFDSYAI